jgi:hypothetical protein
LYQNRRLETCSAPWAGALLVADGLERPVGIPERDGTGQRSRPGPNRIAVVAALHDPLTVQLANDLTDVVRPNHDRANGGSSGI